MSETENLSHVLARARAAARAESIARMCEPMSPADAARQSAAEARQSDAIAYGLGQDAGMRWAARS